MIDLSKYEKVYSWNGIYELTMYTTMFAGPVCYLIKIGESLYVGETSRLWSVAKHHWWLLKNNQHPNKKMQEVFSKEEEFDVYILERLDVVHSIPEKRKTYFVNLLNADLNGQDKELCIVRDLCNHPKNEERVSFNLESKLLDIMNGICKQQEISMDELAHTAIANFIWEYKFRTGFGLCAEGISCIAENLYFNSVEKIKIQKEY